MRPCDLRWLRLCHLSLLGENLGCLPVKHNLGLLEVAASVLFGSLEHPPYRGEKPQSRFENFAGGEENVHTFVYQDQG